MKTELTDEQLPATLAKSKAMKDEFTSLWPELEQRYKAFQAASGFDLFAAQECAWLAFKKGREGK